MEGMEVEIHSRKTVQKLFGVLLLAASMLGATLSWIPDALYANGNTPPAETKKNEDPCAEVKARLAKLEAEKRAREKRLAEARKKAAAKKVAAAKTKKAAVKQTPPPKPSSEDIAMEMLFTGGRMVEEGRYKSALRTLRNFVKLKPRSTDGWYLISRAHHALGDYDRAQLAANIALQIDPDYPPLTKTPNGLQPVPRPTKQSNKEPRPSMSVLPVKQPVPARLPLEPVIISFPLLMGADDVPDATDMRDPSDRDPVTGAWLRYSPYPPLARGQTVAWQQNERFMEISRWRFRVDRMAILKEPRVVVAWKGTYPYEVYFWTGTEWARARREKLGFDWVERYDDILYLSQERIRSVLADRNYRWSERDTSAVAAAASAMRYWWQGEIDLGDAKSRVEKRERDEAMTSLSEKNRRGD